jgi:Flp pilus assembly protein TadB
MGFRPVSSSRRRLNEAGEHVQTRRPRVEVITEAEPSPDQQLHRRQIQYFTLMLMRVACLILAAVLVSADVPYALVWVLILTVGMVLFPWMAVMVANDRPPREESKFTNKFRRSAPSRRALDNAPAEQPEAAAPERPELGPKQLPPSAAKVIDAD